MTRYIKFFAAAVGLLVAGSAFGEITGSKHDFQAQTWSDQEICKPCHTPHNADITLTGRLWAHDLSTATYKYHGGTVASSDGSTSLDAGTGSAAQTDMDQASRLCLSCHDGTVALDSFMGKDPTKVTGEKIGIYANSAEHYNPDLAGATLDLSNDHPVGYKAAYKEDAGLTIVGGVVTAGEARYKPTAQVMGSGLKLAISKTALPASYTWRTATKADGTAYATPGQSTNYYSVSCVSCHNVHNSGAPEERGLLRISNVGSAMCLTCHNK